jgi:hypothetical protein
MDDITTPIGSFVIAAVLLWSAHLLIAKRPVVIPTHPSRPMSSVLSILRNLPIGTNFEFQIEVVTHFEEFVLSDPLIEVDVNHSVQNARLFLRQIRPDE